MPHMKRIGFFLLAICAVCLSGCGTICNFASGDPQPYGGLTRDMDRVGSGQQGGGGHISSPLAIPILLGLGAGELVATSIADTLTMPYFIISRQAEIKRDQTENKEDYSKLPVQYSAGAAVLTPVSVPADSVVRTGEK